MKMKFKRTLESSKKSWNEVLSALLTTERAKRTELTELTEHAKRAPRAEPFPPLGTHWMSLDLPTTTSNYKKECTGRSLGTIWSEVALDTSNLRRARGMWLKDDDEPEGNTP